MKKTWDTHRKALCSWGYVFAFPGLSEPAALNYFKSKETAHAWVSEKIEKFLSLLDNFGSIARFEMTRTGDLNYLLEISNPQSIDIRSYVKQIVDIDVIALNLDIHSFIPNGQEWAAHDIKDGAILTFWFGINSDADCAITKIPFFSLDLYTEIYDEQPIYAGGDNTIVANKNRPTLQDFVNRLKSELSCEIEDEELHYDPFGQKII